MRPQTGWRHFLLAIAGFAFVVGIGPFGSYLGWSQRTTVIVLVSGLAPALALEA